MKKSSCEVLLQFFPKISEVEDLRSTFIVNSVFNSFLCYAAIMLNIVTIHTIRETSSFLKTLKILLLSLGVSDVVVGLFVHSFYTSLLIKLLQQSNLGCYKKAVHIIVLNQMKQSMTYYTTQHSVLGGEYDRPKPG